MSQKLNDQAIQESITTVMNVMEKAGQSDYIGEKVSQLEHALECAHFARKADCPAEVILATLLHDVGHLIAGPDAKRMAGLGIVDHEHIGAEYLLSLGFSSKVAELVRGHVQGKRYLVFKNETYRNHLSEASQGTLKFQGGAMTAEEAAEFERDPLFKEKIQVRKFDELGKQNLKVEPLESYVDLMKDNLMKGQNPLSADQMSFWKENGYIVLKKYFTNQRQKNLRTWVEDLGNLPETAGKWMKYFEKDASGNRMLCRVENFIPFHDGLAGLLKGQEMLNIVSQLMGERAILFKEKINYKLPGGKGFAPHQDAPAFITFNQKYHITLMVSVDSTTPENGCLEMVRGRHQEGTLAQEKDGSLAADVVNSMQWEYLTTEPGDLVLFDSYIPHRSGANTTAKPRRAYYITYNRASEGDRRNDYYNDKREKFPPDVERIPGKDYSAGSAIYNLANPIDK